MEASGSQTGNMNGSLPGFVGVTQQDQKLLFGILEDENASKTLKAMVRDVLRQKGVNINGSGSGDHNDLQDGSFSLLRSDLPFGPVSPSTDHHLQLQMLETSHLHMPTAADSERMTQFMSGNNIETPSYYPQQPMANAGSLEHFRLHSLDTLFFIFYYNEGTYAQQMAAKVLKEKSWNYHTKYLMWFKRMNDPDIRTEDFEMGTYSYFDMDEWVEKIKPAFVFEYKYLENRDLS